MLLLARTVTTPVSGSNSSRPRPATPWEASAWWALTKLWKLPSTSAAVRAEPFSERRVMETGNGAVTRDARFYPAVESARDDLRTYATVA